MRYTSPYKVEKSLHSLGDNGNDWLIMFHDGTGWRIVHAFPTRRRALQIKRLLDKNGVEAARLQNRLDRTNAKFDSVRRKLDKTEAMLKRFKPKRRKSPKSKTSFHKAYDGWR